LAQHTYGAAIDRNRLWEIGLKDVIEFLGEYIDKGPSHNTNVTTYRRVIWLQTGMHNTGRI